jgi:hypothetical protein
VRIQARILGLFEERQAIRSIGERQRTRVMRKRLRIARESHAVQWRQELISNDLIRRQVLAPHRKAFAAQRAAILGDLLDHGGGHSMKPQQSLDARD